MTKLEKDIRDIVGISEKEAKIFLSLLSLGEGTVIDIAKKSGLKRTTVYNLIPLLVERGLLQTALKKKKRIFFVEDVRSIQTRLEERERKFEKILPELLARHNVLPFKPKITYYEGHEGMKELYMDTLKTCQPGDEIVSVMGLKNIYEMFTHEFADWYINERVKKKISLRMIATDSPEARNVWKKGKKELRKVKIVKDPDFQFQGDMEIYRNKVALISYPENFMGVIIESKQISDMHRASFELM